MRIHEELASASKKRGDAASRYHKELTRLIEQAQARIA